VCNIKIIATLIEREVTSREKQLYQQTLTLEKCAGLAYEMEDWNTHLGEDGLDEI